MRAIPARLLIHQAELVRYSAVPESWDTMLGPPEPERVPIKRIRIEPSSRLIASKDNTQVQLTALLIYDCRHSRPADTAIQQGDAVIYNGREYLVQTVDSLHDGQRLHHYEVGLA